MSPDAPPSIQTYDANCHCGKVAFSVRVQDLASSKIVSCNCSICTKNGYLFVYPRREDVVFRSGELEMTSYRFGHAKKPHKFCPACGTSVLVDFSEADGEAERRVTAVNIRTFVGVEDLVKDLDLKHVDGKRKLGPVYTTPRLKGE